MVPIDVGTAGVDFLSCPTFKWLWGPLGAGFLYVRRDLLELGPPPLVGWMSAQNPADFDVHRMNLHDDARRLQRGVHNGAGLVAARAGLRIVDALGVERIWAHVRDLSRLLLAGLEAGPVPLQLARKPFRVLDLAAARLRDLRVVVRDVGLGEERALPALDVLSLIHI